MEKNEYIKAYEIEETNWYFVSRKNFFFKLLDKYIKNKSKILDVGSGAGSILKGLKKYGSVQGVDFSDYAVKFCKMRGLNCLHASIENLPFNDNSFDVITAFGVIEHVNDDKALKEIIRVCKKGGLIILECPAYQFLWSQHDIALHHKRRYTINSLRKKLEIAGMKIEKMSYIYSLIFFPAVFFRLLRKIFGNNEARTDPFEKIPKFLNKLMINIENIEAEIMKRINLPFGISIVCIARK